MVVNKGRCPVKFPVYFAWFRQLLWLRTWVKWDKWHETFLCQTWCLDWPTFIYKTLKKVARIPHYSGGLFLLSFKNSCNEWLICITSGSGCETCNTNPHDVKINHGWHDYVHFPEFEIVKIWIIYTLVACHKDENNSVECFAAPIINRYVWPEFFSELILKKDMCHLFFTLVS